MSLPQRTWSKYAQQRRSRAARAAGAIVVGGLFAGGAVGVLELARALEADDVLPVRSIAVEGTSSDRAHATAPGTPATPVSGWYLTGTRTSAPVDGLRITAVLRAERHAALPTGGPRGVPTALLTRAAAPTMGPVCGGGAKSERADAATDSTASPRLART